jgi:predicted regulator of Ras-like GTPase activity (Roadblock/LC7/MglB family)
MADQYQSHSRSARLDRVLSDLLGRAPELQAASVVSFDGLPMASSLPAGMDEDRVAAMSAALLSLGERAAEHFGRGTLSQVYVEGEHGTVFLVSADDEAVLVAVGAKGAKVGLLMFEVRHSAAAVAQALRLDDAAAAEASLSAPPPALLYPVEPQEAPVATLAVAPPPAVAEPDPLLSAPALHVVDSADVEDVAPAYEPAAYEPAAYEPAYGDEVAAPSSAWGLPSKPLDEPRTDPAHWTAYDQTASEQTSADQPGHWS